MIYWAAEQFISALNISPCVCLSVRLCFIVLIHTSHHLCRLFALCSWISWSSTRPWRRGSWSTNTPSSSRGWDSSTTLNFPPSLPAHFTSLLLLISFLKSKDNVCHEGSLSSAFIQFRIRCRAFRDRDPPCTKHYCFQSSVRTISWNATELDFCPDTKATSTFLPLTLAWQVPHNSVEHAH